MGAHGVGDKQSIAMPPNVCRERSRHGKTVYYFRVAGSQKIRIREEPNTPQFYAAVAAARVWAGAHHKPRARRGTFDIRNKQKLGDAIARALHSARARAAERRLDFDLDIDWLLRLVERQGFTCLLTKIPFFWNSDGAKGRHPYSPSIDRIDCSRGYTRDNVRIVTVAMNIMLADWGEDVLYHVAKMYLKNRR